MSQFAAEVCTLRKRFGTLFADLHGPAAAVPVAVAYDNEPETEPDIEKPFVRLRVDFVETYLAGLGNPRYWRDIGLVIAQVHVPQGKGEKVLLELMDEIAVVFKSQTIVDGAIQMVFWKPKPQRIGAEGPWYQANVITRWQSDFTAP